MTFTSWEEADKNLSNATTYLYDVLITNTIENHGLDLVRRAVAIHSTLPVVSIVDPRFSTAYYQAGAWAVIPKPVVEDVFLAWLQRAVRISSLGRKVTRQKEALERYARSLEQSTHFSTSRAVDDHERKNR